MREFFDRYFHIKNYGEYLRHHRQILVEFSRNAPYNKSIESYIERSLKKAMPQFTMEFLLKQLSERGPELDGEVFEVLSAFTDFLAFKEMILDYRAVKEGKVQDLSSGISITSVKCSHINKDDDPME